jgi:hypothetical protein
VAALHRVGVHQPGHGLLVSADIGRGDVLRGTDQRAGAKGDQVLQVEFPDDVDLSKYELVEDCKPYRERCVPAALIKAHATVTLMSDHPEDGEADAPFLPIRGLPRLSKADIADRLK